MKRIAVLLVLVIAVGTAYAQQGPGTVWKLVVDGDIGRGTVSYLREGLSAAAEAGAAAAIIELATPGGYLDSAITARDIILDASIPTIAFVNREAYSAGALLAIACNRIYFAPGGVMGAATPVYFESGGIREAPEKVISATRKLFAATAETRGRDPAIAQAMVDRSVSIGGLIEAGKLLTLTSEEALKWGYSDGEVEGIDQILEAEGIAGAGTVPFPRRVLDSTLDLLTSSWVAAILITVGLLGLIAEMMIPGFGVPGIVGLSALGLFFWSHFVVGLAGWESVLFLFAGIIAILLEVFVFTGTTLGIAGLAGLVLLGLGFYTSMLGPLAGQAEALHAILAVSLGIAIAVGGAIFLITRLPRTRLRFGGVILANAITGRAYDVRRKRPTGRWVGKVGTAATDLRPVGKGEFSGELVDVVCEEGFLDKGTTIVVTKDEGYRKVVRKKEAEK